MKIKIFFFFFISLVQCIKTNDFCYLKKGKTFSKCNEKYNFKCGSFACTTNQKNCEFLSLFSALEKIHKTRLNLMVKECSETSKYKWNANDVCLNAKNCVKFLITIWSFQAKQNECKCIGKYSYKCNSDYCGLNKHACDGLSKKISKIKKCF